MWDLKLFSKASKKRTRKKLNLCTKQELRRIQVAAYLALPYHDYATQPRKSAQLVEIARSGGKRCISAFRDSIICNLQRFIHLSTFLCAIFASVDPGGCDSIILQHCIHLFDVLCAFCQARTGRDFRN